MKPIDQYATLSDFTADLDQTPALHVPYKIMGKRRSDAFFSISMLAEVHRQTTAPDTLGPYQAAPAPFGEILARGARLHAHLTYSAITAHPSGANHYQGDIIELDLSRGGQYIPQHRFSMLLSHTCDIQKLSHVTVAPAYLESELTGAAITQLRDGVAPKDPRQIREMWISNEVPTFLGLPATDITNAPGGERVLVGLHLGTPVPRKVVLSSPTKLRLKYRASAYLQGRLSVLLMRDVQRSDETREL